MERKVITKKGDIFCVEIEGKYKQFFQYITLDKTMLCSVVIRVFKTKYAIQTTIDLNSIVTDDVSFYAHTMLRPGLFYKAWSKIGNHRDVGNTKDIMFRYYSNGWSVWKINEPFIMVKELDEEKKKYNLGIVYSYLDIVERIKTGHYRLPLKGISYNV
jgi:hypothetical protein